MKRRAWATPAALVVGLAALRPDPASGLDPAKAITQYGLQVWTAEQGLPQNSVQTILQTRDGYIWLGTQEGLARFDGVRFTVFDDKKPDGLRNHHVLALCEDRQGNLWIGTRGGGLIRLRDGVFAAFTSKQGLANDIVRTVFEDHRGTLWVGTDGGLSRFEDGRLTTQELPVSGSQAAVMAVAETGEALWFGTDGAGLHRLENGRLRTFTRREGLSSDSVRGLYADRDGSLWIGTRGGGLNRFSGGRFIRYPTQDGAWGTIGGGIRRDRDGGLWVGTNGGGLLRLREGEFQAHTKKEGFAGDIVQCIYEDREGSLWIGTDGEGLARLKDGKFTTYSVEEGLPHDMVLPIYEDREESLWMGTYGGGLARLRDGRFTAYNTKHGLSSDLIVSLVEDREGSLWIGTDGGGLNRFRGGKFTHYGTREGLSNNRVVALHEDAQGSLWIGTFGGGLNRFRNGKFAVYGSAQGLSADFIRSIGEDSDGNLWIGTDREGLTRFQSGKFQTYTTRDGLADDTVYCIYPDSQGSLWIGTYGGLSRFRGGKWSRVTTKEGLFDNKIWQILEDDAGNLWMSCNRGVFRISKKELNDFADGKIRSVTSVSYGKANGMKSSECNGTSQPAGWKTHDGRLWFPTNEGAVTIDPARIRINDLPPPVAIEEVVIDKVRFDARQTHRVPPGRGEIEIQYTAMSFLDPERVRFRYKLEGFDTGWVDAGPRRAAFYTNIPPGEYRFRVVASNNDGIWNETGSAFGFVLRPHFYQAIWFYVLCTLSVLSLAFGGYQYRLRGLTRRKNELTRLVAQRTEQFENANRELEKANRTLRQLSAVDGLTGIANRRQFDEVLAAEWRRAFRRKVPLSLLMIDIDSFKAYNDAYGHQEGDECLKRVAATLRGLLNRPGDFCARYGGEEFVAILPETAAEGACAVAESLRAGIEAAQIPHEGASRGFVTISVGVGSAFPRENASDTSLVAAADKALYRAKETGRNRVGVFDAQSVA